MKRKHPLLIFLIVLFINSCSEPFNFDLRHDDIDVIDGRISTMPGRSNINIYRAIDDSRAVDGRNRESLSELAVTVLSGGGEEFHFFYDRNTLSYKPVDPEFAAVQGESYRMIARSPDNHVYESTFDSTPSSIDFEIGIQDTVTQELTEAKRIIVTEGIAALALIPPQENTFYVKLDFRFTYQNYFDSTDLITRFNSNNYVLLKCDGSFSCLRDFKIPVGFKQTETPWRFLNPASLCETIGKCENPPNPTVTCCLPCCMDVERWEADYEISLKALSERSYDYWENIDRLRENDGLIFDVNPFPVGGNVTCEGCENQVVGIFRSYSETVAVVNKILR